MEATRIDLLGNLGGGCLLHSKADARGHWTGVEAVKAIVKVGLGKEGKRREKYLKGLKRRGRNQATSVSQMWEPLAQRCKFALWVRLCVIIHWPSTCCAL